LTRSIPAGRAASSEFLLYYDLRQGGERLPPGIGPSTLRPAPARRARPDGRRGQLSREGVIVRFASCWVPLFNVLAESTARSLKAQLSPSNPGRPHIIIIAPQKDEGKRRTFFPGMETRVGFTPPPFLFLVGLETAHSMLPHPRLPPTRWPLPGCCQVGVIEEMQCKRPVHQAVPGAACLGLSSDKPAHYLPDGGVHVMASLFSKPLQGSFGRGVLGGVFHVLHVLEKPEAPPHHVCHALFLG